MGGSYLTKPITKKETISGGSPAFGTATWAMSCMQGWRQSMEDAHICESSFDVDTQLYAVFDGHGGFEVALFAEKHFGRLLKENAAYQAKDFTAALKETFMKVDEFLRTEDGKDDLLRIVKTRNPEQQKVQDSAGCTANVTLIYKNTIYVANAGDSRCVLSCAGKSEDLSTDHKPNDEIEFNRIKKAGGTVTNGRVNGNLNLSRALGDLSFKANMEIPQSEQLISAYPDVVVREITAKDEFLLIGCDGIWELKTNQELITICRKRLAERVEMTEIVENLLDEIIAKDTTQGLGCDNMSMILVKLKRNITCQEVQANPDSFAGNGVSDKYIAAGLIADTVIEEITKRAQPAANLAELCAFGDDLVEQEVKKVFLKDKVKGVAYPTTVSVNELVSNVAPSKNASVQLTLKKGDLVKISVGVHIGGFIAESATTIICTDGAVVAGVEGRKADVIHAAYYAAQTALRTLTPESGTFETAKCIVDTAAAFNCSTLNGVRSYEMTKNSRVSDIFIPSAADLSAGTSHDHRYEPNDVFTLNVVVSTGKGLADSNAGVVEPTIFVHQKDKHLNQVGLKKNIVSLYTKIAEENDSFAFHSRRYTEDPVAEKALVDFVKQEVIVPQTIASEPKGEYVATFKLTAVITLNGLILLSGNKWANPLEGIKSAHSLAAHPHLTALLEKDVLKKKKPKNKKK